MITNDKSKRSGREKLYSSKNLYKTNGFFGFISLGKVLITNLGDLKNSPTRRYEIPEYK